MEKEIIGIEQVVGLVDDFAAKYPAILSQVEIIVGMSRGGLVPAALLAARIGKPLAAAYIDKNDGIFLDRADWIKGKNILVVDDIIRSGKTLWLLKNHIENNAEPVSISFFAMFKVVPLNDEKYGVRSFSRETDHDMVLPWDK